MSDRKERIRTKAYELWEQAGRPEGEETTHWAEAERRIDAEDGGSEVQSGGTPDQTGPSQPEQIETVDAPIPVKRRKKASVRPTRTRSDAG
jgi:hypothetical protein